MKTSKILAILLTLSLLFVSAGCDGNVSSGSVDVKNTVQFKAGKVAYVGDIFELPQINTSEDADAPVIVETTSQANPGDSLTVMGEGFTKDLKAYIYAQSTKENGKAYEAAYEYVSDQQIVVKIDESIEYGIYVVYIETSKGISNYKTVNAPTVWWNGFTALKCGESFTVYGENLTTDNGEKETNAWLVGDNEYCEAEITYADPFKVTVKIPEGLEAGNEYELLLHNGHGGDLGFVKAPEKINIVDKRANDFSDGKLVNVVDYGAKPDDTDNDDSEALRKAITSAEEGDTIYFPVGTYVLDEKIAINKSLKLLGEDMENTVIAPGLSIKNVSGSDTRLITINKGPCEITNLSFVNVRDTGTIPSNIIHFEDASNQTGSWYFNVHNCRYSAKSSEFARAGSKFVSVFNTNGILLQNNDVASPGMYSVAAKNVSGQNFKLFVNGNRYYGQNYFGAYYDGMNCMTLTAVDMADVSNNYFASADILVDDTHVIDVGDFHNGRSMSIQGWSSRFYIAKNEIVASDILGHNSGEQIMSEGPRIVYHENPSAASANTVTLPNYSPTLFSGAANDIPQAGYRIYISKGKGFGQQRIITDITGTVFTVDKDWDVIPDSTSVICVTGGHYNFAIYDNNVSGAANHSEEGGGGCGVMIYGDVYNFKVYGNEITDVNTGIYLEQHALDLTDDPASSGANSSAWVIISGNKITKANVGIRTMNNNAMNLWNGAVPMYLQFGVSIRRNEFIDAEDWTASNLAGIGGVGIMYSRNWGDYVGSTSHEHDRWNAGWQYGTVIENNSFVNCARANILMGMFQQKTLLLNNKVSGPVTELWTADNQFSQEPFICK